MKNDLISVFCIALVCATVMLGIMGVYRLIGPSAVTRNHIEGKEHIYSVSDALYPGIAGKGIHSL